MFVGHAAQLCKTPAVAMATVAAIAASALLAPGRAAAVSSDWVSTDVSQVRLISARNDAGKLGEMRFGLQFRLEPGWKIYWRSPGDAGSPPMADFSASKNVDRVEMRWPAPQRFFEAADLETIGYLDGTVFPLTVTARRPGQPVHLRAVVDYQACENICIPFTAELALDVPSGPGEPSVFAQLVERYETRVPRDAKMAGIEVVSAGVNGEPPAQHVQIALASPVPFEAPEMFVEATGAFRFPASTASVGRDRTEVVLRALVESRDRSDLAGEHVILTVIDGERGIEVPLSPIRAIDAGSAETPIDASLRTMIAIALLGGLILNLMPCVLPVLSLKLLSVVGHGGGERRQVSFSFMASAAGIVASFLLLAAAAVVVKLGGGAVGWGMQFQQPLFLVFLVLVLSLFAYNLFGIYEIGMPGWLGDVGSHAGRRAEARSGMLGHFVTGAFATLMATPCSAPILGTAIGFALSRGAGEIFAIFSALGIGMALPYLVVAAFPAIATGLPRPGRWMIWVRIVLGVALAGTVMWLLSVLAVQAGVIAAAAVTGLVVLAAPALRLARTGQPFRGAGLAALVGVLIGSFVAPLISASPNAASDPEGQTLADVHWRPFDTAVIATALAEGRTVLVDVTADWCVTCQVNKRLTLESEGVAQRLREADVVCVRADWTRPDARIARYLASFGRYGIPFNVVYGPNAREGLVLPELLTGASVLTALDSAS